MAGYQTAPLVKKDMCWPEVVEESVSFMHFKPVWASGDSKTVDEQICNLPVCKWLAGGIPVTINATDKCESCRVQVPVATQIAHTHTTYLRSCDHRPLLLALASAGMDWNFIPSNESDITNYFLAVDADVVASKNEKYKKILQNKTVCFGSDVIVDQREHRMCVAVQTGPLALLLSGSVTVLLGLFTLLLNIHDPLMPSWTLYTWGVRLAIISAFSAIAIGSVVAIAKAQSGGYILMANYRLGTVASCFISMIEAYCLTLYDVNVSRALPGISTISFCTLTFDVTYLRTYTR